MGVKLHTANLTLRKFQGADTPLLYEFMSNAEAMQYTYVASSIDQCARRLHTYEELRSRDGFAPWVVERTNTGRVVGWGGLSIDPEIPGWGLEVSYAFSPDCWGLGFASELVLFSVTHAFERLSAAEVHAFAMPQNAASIRVLEKCGFKMLRYEPSLSRNNYVISRQQPRCL